MRRLMYEARAQLASPVRNPRMATVVGRLLGVAFLLCFGTGLYSHFLQEPLPWMRFATRPSGLYQVTQGIHITAGIACVPLLLAKLWIVFPELLTYPPVTGVVSFLERASIAALMGSTFFMLASGTLNIIGWYPWEFSFRRTHEAVAWVAIVFELTGVLVIGALSIFFPDLFPHDTVWSMFGRGYAFIPLVLPIFGIWWLRTHRPALDAQEAPSAEVSA